MVPARSNVQLHHDSRRSSSKPHYSRYTPAATTVPARRDRLRPRRVAMADADEEDEAQRRRRHGEDQAAEAPRTSGGIDVDSKDWLQLGLATASSSRASGDSMAPMETDLFADKRSTRVMRLPLPAAIRSYRYRYGPTTASGSTMPAPLPRPLRSFPGDLAMRVISPPPLRTSTTEAAGLWLTLHAAHNQAGDPILPQIPKIYLRIKDINMKVELVMKYLSDKIGLPQSHQLELTCRGQLLPPFLLLKYVRDTIWCSPAAAREEELPAGLPPPPRQSPAAATDHVMTLFYSTSRNHRSL